MIMIILSVIYLCICSYTDIRYKKINILLSAIVGITGLSVSILSLCRFNSCLFNNLSFSVKSAFFTEHTSFFTLAASVLISIFMMIISLLTKGALGAGDCIMIAVLACFMSPYHIISMLLYGLIFSGIAALFLLTVEKCSRKDTLSFAPFLLIGHIIYYIFFTGIF